MEFMPYGLVALVCSVVIAVIVAFCWCWCYRRWPCRRKSRPEDGRSSSNTTSSGGSSNPSLVDDLEADAGHRGIWAAAAPRAATSSGHSIASNSHDEAGFTSEVRPRPRSSAFPAGVKPRLDLWGHNEAVPTDSSMAATISHQRRTIAGWSESIVPPRGRVGPSHPARTQLPDPHERTPLLTPSSRNLLTDSSQSRSGLPETLTRTIAWNPVQEMETVRHTKLGTVITRLVDYFNAVMDEALP